MAYRCLRCHPAVVECKTIGNMKSHLGATTLAHHNMGPFRCQEPGCGKLALRGDAVQNHGDHQAVWASDPALEGPLDTLAEQCKWPWAQGVVPGPPPAAQAPGAAQIPPAAVVVPAPGAGAGAAPAVPARARVPARAPTPPAEVEALALDPNLEWLHEGNGDEVREVEEEPIPGYYYEFGFPYGTGPAIPGGR